MTYEVQIDGESFPVEGGRPPIKVESKLKPGTTYMLGVRVARTQTLRLNSVQMEYGMWATVTDNKGKDLRTAKIVHELGFSLEITDLDQPWMRRAGRTAEHPREEFGATLQGPQGDGFEADGSQGPEIRSFRQQVVQLNYRDSEGVGPA